MTTKKPSSFVVAALLFAALACGGGGSNANLEATIAAQNTQIAALGNSTHAAETSTPESPIVGTQTGIESPSASSTSSSPGATPTQSNMEFIVAITDLGAGPNIWNGYPTYAAVGKENSSREGYRAVVAYFYAYNATDKLQTLDIFTTGNYHVVDIQAADPRGFTYKFRYDFVISIPVSHIPGESFRFPPNFGVLFYAVGEIPNNATGLSLNFTSSYGSLNVPLPSADNSTGSGGTGDVAYQMNYRNPPSVADLTKAWPSISGTATVADLARVTLTSAICDSKTSSWIVKVEVMNQYGYDLSLDSGRHAIQFEVISEAGLFLAPLDSYYSSSNKVITPGATGIWEITIPVGGCNDKVQWILVTSFMRSVNDPAFLQSVVSPPYAGHRLQQP